MPANRTGDFALNGMWYILSRPFKDTNGMVSEGGRSWQRLGNEDSPVRRSVEDITYGNLPDALDHAEVWDDWTGGFGDFYRRPERLNAYHFAQNFDTRFPRQLIHAQQMNTLASVYNVDSLIDVPLVQGSGAPAPPAGAGTVLLVGPGATGVRAITPNASYTNTPSGYDMNVEATGTAFGHRPAVFGSFTMIPNLNGSGWTRRGNDGLTYTSNGGTTAKWFAVAAGVLWWDMGGGNLRNLSISNVASPEATANWGATLNIGLGARTSADAVALNNQLYVGFPDGLYQGALTGTFQNVTNNLGVGINADNVRDLSVMDGTVVFQEGSHVFMYQPSTGANSVTREVGPSGLLSNRSAIRGRFTCMEPYGKWLLAGLFTGSQSYVMAGIEASNGLPYVWHPMQLLPATAKISRIHIDAITQSSGGAIVPNRMWVATEATYGAQTGATAPLYVMPIPQGYDNPVSDMTFSATYIGSARIDLGQTDWQAPGTPKIFREAEVWSEGNVIQSGAQYGNLYYTLDNGNRTLLGYVGTGPKCVLYFPSTANSFVSGQAMQLSLESFTASLGITPIWRAIVLRGTSAPLAVDQITAKVRIADNMPDRNGGTMRPGATMLAELRGFAAGQVPTLLTDLTGAQQLVKVQNNIQETEAYQQGAEYPETEAMIKMSVLTFTLMQPIAASQTLAVI